ncbi:hypothetical protein LguiB_023078 [Lonicera macranthoides]
MGSNKANDDDNPPVYTSLQEHVNTSQNRADYSRILQNVNNAGADLMSFPYMSMPVASSPWDNMHGAYPFFAHNIPESGDNLMADLMGLNTLQNPRFDPNSMDIRTNMPILTPSEIANPHWNMTGIHQSGNHEYMVKPENLTNCGIDYSSFQNSLKNRNFRLPISHTVGGFQLPRQCGEAKSSNNNSPLIHENLPSLRGSSTPMLYHTQNTGDTQIANNVKVNSNEFGLLEKIDGSFLSLGIGGNTEARYKSTLSSHEIARQLEETDSPQLNSSHAQQITRNYSSPGHNLVSGFPSFQGNASGLEGSVSNVVGWTSCNNNVGTVCGANGRLSSNALHTLQAPQFRMQRNISMPSNRNSSFASKREATYMDLNPPKGFQGDHVASSGEFSSSSSTGLLGSGQFGLAPQSANTSWITTQTTSDKLQKCPKNFSSESSMISPFPGIRGSSTGRGHSGALRGLGTPHHRKETATVILGFIILQSIIVSAMVLLGQLLSAHDGTAAQAGGHLFPKRMVIQPNEGCVAQVATGGLFPKRLGFEVNDSGASQAADGNMFPSGMGVQAASKFSRPQNSGSTQFPRNFVGSPIAIGRPRGTVPSQVSIGLHGPSSTTGQVQNVVPSHFARNLQRPISTTGQGIPVANVHGPAPPASNSVGRKSLKRGAIRPPSVAPLTQRRKISQHPVQSSMPPHPPPTQQHAPPPPSTGPASVAGHIKWQDPNAVSEPSGRNCPLCKRDLSFTADGPVYQPAAPPPVAVLPCGHIFHDHCLQLITPQNQAKDPPCIPCAIGEN